MSVWLQNQYCELQYRAPCAASANLAQSGDLTHPEGSRRRRFWYASLRLRSAIR